MEHGFEPKYITIRGKGELLAKLRRSAKKAEKVYLATDPDREGEAISWHLSKALNLDEKKMRKVSYRTITAWLVKVGLMEEEEISAGKCRKVPTASGIAMGITTEIRTGVRGEYPCVVYDENAQEFVIENLNTIMNPTDD